jgi:hypothetical protein
MKVLPVLLSSAVLIALPAASAQVIAKWTFEVSIPTTAGPHTAEEGFAAGTSFASASHASSATVYSNPVGNGSAKSFNANNWSIGDYYQFQVDLGAFPLPVTPDAYVEIRFDQTRSSTGPADFSLLVSTDGTTFASLLNYTVGAVAWSSLAYNPASTFSTGSVSTTGGLLGASTLWFRLVANSAPSSTAGTNRVDDFTVSVVPEPSTYAMLLGAAVLTVVWVRRRLR